MQFACDKSFDDYVASGDETSRQILKENGAAVQAVRSFYAFFTSELWSASPNMSPQAGIMAMNAHMMFIAGVRMAMTGHAQAVFPLMRVALEYGCYAFLMQHNADLFDLWSRRHSDEKSRKACRAAFTDAVRKTATRLDEIQAGSGAEILQVYEAAIDFGAHPNPLGVFPRLKFVDRSDETLEVSVAGLYDPDHSQTARSMVACLDFGLAVAIVLTRCLQRPTQDVQEALDTLGRKKDEALKDFVTRGIVEYRE